MKQTVTTIFGVLISVMIFAQAPQAFNYQGVARDLSGSPIPNQNIGLQIAILQGSINGNEVYKETHNPTTTDLGLFNLQIGTGTVVNGNFEAIDWGNDNHFLRIELDENGGSNYQVIGTSELLSVPYALFSGNNYWEKDDSDNIFYENGAATLFGDYGSNNMFQTIERSIDNLSGDSIVSSVFIGDFGSNWTFAGYSGPMIRFNRNTDDHINFPEDRAAIIRSVDNLEFRVEEVNSTGPPSIKMVINEDGNVGIGESEPKAKLQISDGDVYIENINNGVIMKSPNGQCWRYTPDNSGQLIPASIACPN